MCFRVDGDRITALESTQEEREDSDRQGTGGKTDLSAL